jgi:hypothetical protein
MDGMLKWAAHAHVIDELMADAINVALPVGACDIDMLALLESRTEPCGLVSVPIKIVVSRSDGLSRSLDAARAHGSLVALVWDVGELAPIRSFALTSAELTLLKMIDLMDGAHAARAGAGAEPAQVRREARLRNAMKPFAMSRGQWRKKLTDIVGGKPEAEPCCRPH